MISITEYNIKDMNTVKISPAIEAAIIAASFATQTPIVGNFPKIDLTDYFEMRDGNAHIFTTSYYKGTGGWGAVPARCEVNRIENATPDQVYEMIVACRSLSYIVLDGGIDFVSGEKIMPAKFAGKCSVTGEAIEVNEIIAYNHVTRKARKVDNQYAQHTSGYAPRVRKTREELIATIEAATVAVAVNEKGVGNIEFVGGNVKFMRTKGELEFVSIKLGDAASTDITNTDTDSLEKVAAAI